MGVEGTRRPLRSARVGAQLLSKGEGGRMGKEG